MQFGLDLLGLARFSPAALQAFPAGWWVGTFSNTFGDARPNIAKLLASGKVKGVRVQLLWKDKHNFTRADIPLAAAEARKWRELVAGNAIDWAFSGACENHLPPADAIAMQHAVMNELPGVTYVHAGSSHIPDSAKVWNEVHGEGRPIRGHYSFSFDGTDAVNENVTAYKVSHGAAKIFMFWTSNFNGRKTDKDPTPRPARKAFPTPNMMHSIVALAGDRGASGLAPGVIWKTHAEQYSDVPPPTARDNKPVLIAPGSAPFAILVVNGLTIATARRFGAGPSKNTSRYYFSEWGFQIADRARQMSGSPLCGVRAGADIGWINPAFREGGYR